MANPTAVAPDGEADRARRAAVQRSDAVVQSVIDALGRPADLLKVTARLVSGNNYRVNVLTGPDVASARIAHSYFVTADAAGAVTGSAPAIQRCYTARGAAGRV